MPVVIFRSRLRPEAKDEHGELFPRMLELARSSPGFMSFKTFAAEDGERVSIIEFETDDAIRAWREHPEHVQAQVAGRERLYVEYEIKVCEPIRKRTFHGKTTVA